MTQWSFDISTAPKGKTVTTTRLVTDKSSASGKSVRDFEEFVPDHIWIATKCGKVSRTYWIPEHGKNPGRWSGLATGEQPIAWMPFVVPAHPNASEDGRAAA